MPLVSMTMIIDHDDHEHDDHKHDLMTMITIMEEDADTDSFYQTQNLFGL